MKSEEYDIGTNRSFKDYTANRFYDKLCAAVSNHIEKYYRMSDSPIDIFINNIYINNLPRMKIEFDVIIEYEIKTVESYQNNRKFYRVLNFAT